MRTEVLNTWTTPSSELLALQRCLAQIAALAKTANQMELFNQAKESHDNLTRQYNAQTAPKKKGFWERLVNNLSMGVDTVVDVPYLEESYYFKDYYEEAKALQKDELLKTLYIAIEQYNNLRKEIKH